MVRMALTPTLSDRPRVLVVGGGYVGLYVAMKLQKKVKAHGGIVTVVDPLPYMTYQPFLPEVAGGQIEARHAVVSHRKHLKDSELISGSVTAIDHANHKAVIAPVRRRAVRDRVPRRRRCRRRDHPHLPDPGPGRAGHRPEDHRRGRRAAQQGAGAHRDRVDDDRRGRPQARADLRRRRRRLRRHRGHHRDRGHGPRRRGQERPPQAVRRALRPDRGHGPHHARGHRGAGACGSSTTCAAAASRSC